MRKTFLLAGVLASLAIGTVAARAQSAELTPTQEAMVRAWKSFTGKVIAMAEDEGFPEDKFGYRPHPDSRSFAEELRHVALATGVFAKRARGEEASFQGLGAKEQESISRAEMVAELKASSEEFVKVLEEKERPNLIGFIAGMSEHYGKLVQIYRVNGLIPPRTRARQ